MSSSNDSKVIVWINAHGQLLNECLPVRTDVDCLSFNTSGFLGFVNVLDRIILSVSLDTNQSNRQKIKYMNDMIDSLTKFQFSTTPINIHTAPSLFRNILSQTDRDRLMELFKVESYIINQTMFNMQYSINSKNETKVIGSRDLSLINLSDSEIQRFKADPLMMIRQSTFQDTYPMGIYTILLDSSSSDISIQYDDIFDILNQSATKTMHSLHWIQQHYSAKHKTSRCFVVSNACKLYPDNMVDFQSLSTVPVQYIHPSPYLPPISSLPNIIPSLYNIHTHLQFKNTFTTLDIYRNQVQCHYAIFDVATNTPRFPFDSTHRYRFVSDMESHFHHRYHKTLQKILYTMTKATRKWLWKPSYSPVEFITNQYHSLRPVSISTASTQFSTYDIYFIMYGYHIIGVVLYMDKFKTGLRNQSSQFWTFLQNFDKKMNMDVDHTVALIQSIVLRLSPFWQNNRPLEYQSLFPDFYLPVNEPFSINQTVVHNAHQYCSILSKLVVDIDSIPIVSMDSMNQYLLRYPNTSFHVLSILHPVLQTTIDASGHIMTLLDYGRVILNSKYPVIQMRCSLSVEQECYEIMGILFFDFDYRFDSKLQFLHSFFHADSFHSLHFQSLYECQFIYGLLNLYQYGPFSYTLDKQSIDMNDMIRCFCLFLITRELIQSNLLSTSISYAHYRSTILDPYERTIQQIRFYSETTPFHQQSNCIEIIANPNLSIVLTTQDVLLMRHMTWTQWNVSHSFDLEHQLQQLACHCLHMTTP